MNDNKSTKHSQRTEAGMHYTACCTLADCTQETNHEEQKIKNAKRGGICYNKYEKAVLFLKGYYQTSVLLNKNNAFKTEEDEIRWLGILLKERIDAEL